MNSDQPNSIPELFILAGPNGAGKSTVARVLLPETLEIKQFVNADNIAAGLSPFDPDSAAIRAGRIMIERMHEFLSARQSFAFESTLAGKSHVPLIHDAHRTGYRVSLIFVYLRSPELALRRVAERVRHGGHDIPPETVHRRYYRGLVNFFGLYKPIVDTWSLCDNSDTELALVAVSPEKEQTEVYQPVTLAEIKKNVERATRILARD